MKEHLYHFWCGASSVKVTVLFFTYDSWCSDDIYNKYACRFAEKSTLLIILLLRPREGLFDSADPAYDIVPAWGWWNLEPSELDFATPGLPMSSIKLDGDPSCARPWAGDFAHNCLYGASSHTWHCGWCGKEIVWTAELQGKSLVIYASFCIWKWCLTNNASLQ